MTTVRRVALFDIDGTLIRAGDPGHRVAFDRALQEVYDVPASLDGISLAGMLDRQIARAALAPFEIDPSVVEAGLADLFVVMGEQYAQLVGPGARRDHLLPGLPTVANALADAGVNLAVVTGSATTVARSKLEAAGLAELFPIGAYGDEADHRGELVLLGLAAASTQAGTTFEPADAIVVGDTPRDIDAARHAGARVLAVATGVVTHELLAEEKPDVLMHDLADIDSVLAAVLDTGVAQ